MHVSQRECMDLRPKCRSDGVWRLCVNVVLEQSAQSTARMAWEFRESAT
jgi:hypothetical protein